MQGKNKFLKFVEQCYALYEQKMYQVAYSILRDSGLAEDAVQNAFVKIIKSNRCFDDAYSDDCKRYMITVIKHSAIDIYNKKKKEQEILYLTDREYDDVSAENDGDLAEAEQVKDMMEALPSKYYEVVECIAMQDMSVKETAEKLGITEVNVRKRYERAKMLLRTVEKGRELYGAV